MRTASQQREEIGVAHAVRQQPSSHTVSSCCGYSVTVCVTAL